MLSCNLAPSRATADAESQVRRLQDQGFRV